MRHAAASSSAPFDRKQGGLLLANMLSAWLDGEPSGEATVEAVHEPQDRRSSPQPIRLCLPAPVDARPSAPSSGEHGTPVCIAREGGGTGLEPSCDPYPRSGPRQVRSADCGTGGFQDVGGRCLHGTSGRRVCLGSLPTLTLGLGLASTAGAVCPHSNPGDRRGWLLRSSRFQRRTSVGVEGDHGPGRAAFFAHAPPGR